MEKNLIATATVTINATDAEVWNGLTNPEIIEKYMMGATVASDWKEGSKITWKGEFKGKNYEDKGEILEIAPQEKLKYTHFSPLSGEDDKPENYHTVTVNLSGDKKQTTVSLTQDKNKNEKATEESEKNWKMMLEGLKKILEEKTK